MVTVNTNPMWLRLAYDHRVQRHDSFEDFARSYIEEFEARDPTLRERMMKLAVEIWNKLLPADEIWHYSTMSPNHPLSGQAGYLAIYAGKPRAMITTMHS